MKSGNLNFLEPSGPPQACNGLLYLYLYLNVQNQSLVYTFLRRTVFYVCDRIVHGKLNHAIFCKCYTTGSFDICVIMVTYLKVLSWINEGDMSRICIFTEQYQCDN